MYGAHSLGFQFRFLHVVGTLPLKNLGSHLCNLQTQCKEVLAERLSLGVLCLVVGVGGGAEIGV